MAFRSELKDIIPNNESVTFIIINLAARLPPSASPVGGSSVYCEVVEFFLWGGVLVRPVEGSCTFFRRSKMADGRFILGLHHALLGSSLF